MIETIKEGSSLQYKKLNEEEKKQRGILGRLVGPIADCLNPTRNGRLYSEELWEKVFDNPIMKEKFKNKVLYGELGHPEDRTEIDMEKIAVCMSEAPKKNSKGQLEGVFDILDTPNGRILKTLCDYGSTLGISSRGCGDVLEDDSVDPDTYECECWDIVLVPAVESARLRYVNESLDTTNRTSLTEALKEQLSEATSDEKAIMEETLENLDIKLNEEECNDESCADKKESEAEESKVETTEEASNTGSDELVESLQDAIKAKSDLEAKIQSLQNELAVSNTKVGELTEELNGYKSNAVRLSALVAKGKEEAKKADALKEELAEKEALIKNLESKVDENAKSQKSLSESISTKDVEFKALNESIKSLKEQLAAKDSEHKAEIEKLTEDAKKEKNKSDLVIKNLKEQLAKSKDISESYKKTANSVVNTYIEEKAVMLGVKKEEIINKLPSKYTLSDINRVCESLKKYALNMNKLPFSIDRSVNKVSITESSDDKARSINPMIDDELDDLTLALLSRNK